MFLANSFIYNYYNPIIQSSTKKESGGVCFEVLSVFI